MALDVCGLVQLESEIGKAGLLGRLCIVEFYSTRTEEVAREALAPSLELYDADSRVQFLKAERSMNPGALQKFQVETLPTVQIFQGRNAVSNIVGIKPQRLQMEIEGYLAAKEDAKVQEAFRKQAASKPSQSATLSAPMSDTAPKGSSDDSLVEAPVNQVILRELAGGKPAQSLDTSDGGGGGSASAQGGGEESETYEGLGISRNRAIRALFLGRATTVEEAVEWLEDHQDDDQGADEPLLVSKAAAAVAQLALDAADTAKGGGSIGADGALGEKRKLSKEELEERIRKRRREKAEAERQMSKAREQKRREEGRKIATVSSQMEEQRRRRDAEVREREKRAQKEERLRLRKTMLRDKAERMAASGDAEGAKQLLEEVATMGVDALMGSRGKSVETRLDEAMKQLKGYRAGGEGLRAMKMLRLIVDNALTKGMPASADGGEEAGDDGDHLKYRGVNTQSKAFEHRVQAFKGGLQTLLAAGFSRSEQDFHKLQCDPDQESQRVSLHLARDKLDGAISEMS